VGARINNYINARQYEAKHGTGSINWTSSFRTYHAQDNDFTAQGYVTYAGQFVDNKLSVEAAAFAETRQYDYRYLNSSTNGGLSVIDYYNLKASTSTYSTNNEESHFKTRSFFGTATIGWDDVVYLDGSIRYDLDSRLPADNNGYLYGGGSLSFMPSKLINAHWLNYWKIRGSLAQVGSTVSAYQIYPTYTIGTKKNGQTTMYEPSTLKNEHVLPTISTSFEVGTEFKMFNNRFYGDVNLYLKNTRNDIIDANVLPQSGYSSRKINAGLVQNKGIEIMVGGAPVSTKNVTWNVSANFAKNVNSLVELTDPNVTDEEYTIYWTKFYYPWYNKAIEGQPIGVITSGARWARNEAGQYILQAGNASWGDVRPTYDLGPEKVVGNVQPKFTGGFSTDIRIKNWTLSASLDYLVGGSLVSWTNMWGTGSGVFASTAKVNNRGVNEREPVAVGGGVYMEGVDKDGNPMSGYVDAYNYYHYKAYYDCDAWIYDRTYVKLRELSLKYQLPEKFLKNLGIGITKASIAFVATNPWLIYSACPNLDPSEIAGVEYNYLEGGQAMSTRTFGLTVNVTF
jgi:outer membrane receptor protein involved in Fe transport